MFPFRAKKPAVEMSESWPEAATASAAGAPAHYLPASPAQPSYPPAAYASAAHTPRADVGKSGPSGGAPSCPAIPAAAATGPHQPPEDVVVQVGEDKFNGYGHARGYQTQPPHGAQYQTAAPPAAPPHNVHVSADASEWSREVRRGFIRKVLFIVFFQLLLTTGVAVAFYSIDEVRSYVTTNIWPFLVAWALSLVAILLIACVKAVQRYPYNYGMLLFFTACFSVLTGCITARYDVEVVAMALAATSAAVLGAWVVAAFTPLDLTNKGGILVAILFGLICVSFIGLFWRSRMLYLIISGVAAILFTFFLIYDLQKLMGGRRRAYSPDDYIIAALNIYLDIVQIFLNLLQLIGAFANGS
eukprot:jgi/Ulvmu1/7671/UM038_0100.1